MDSAFNILLIAVLFCVLQLLVIASLLRSSVAGVKTLTAANAIGIAAFILYGLGRELPPLIAYEIANGVYAAAGAIMLAGFRRLFSRHVPWVLLSAGIVLVMIAIAVFHYMIDSYALRTVTVAVFQSAVCADIGLTVFRSRKSSRSRYPYVFTIIMTVIIVLGHSVRSAIYLAHPTELTSLLQPSPWNLFFLSAGAMVMPVLTLGAVMMIHDRMMERAEHAANRDFLTGAWSRRPFFEMAERELARAARTGRPLSLLLLDIDHFKAINDSAGHAAGDKVLMDVVLRASTVIRGTDYFARIGGEEFAVLLPETDRPHALMVAERLRAALQNTAKHDDAQSPPPYTVSIGLAQLRGAESFHALMQRADTALYKAKASGRNLVVCEPQADAGATTKV